VGGWLRLANTSVVSQPLVTILPTEEEEEEDAAPCKKELQMVIFGATDLGRTKWFRCGAFFRLGPIYCVRGEALSSQSPVLCISLMTWKQWVIAINCERY
jgi:hypothetical protein